MTPRAQHSTRAATLSVVLGVVLAGCGGADKAPLNVLVITLDTLRADRVGAYGYMRDTTPHLDAFAKESVLFEQAFAASSFTPPTHASILTGRYPGEHGMLHWNKHLADVPTAAQLFAEAGYRTGAFTPMPTLLKLGLDKGFTEQQSPPHHVNGQQIVLADADAINAVALPWLTASAEQTGGKPFFAWVHYYDAHRPYGRQGPEWSGRFARPDDPAVGATEEWYQLSADERAKLALDTDKVDLIEDHYDGGLTYLDDRVGRLLDELRARGVLQHTIVVILADHGEIFDEHEPEWFAHDPYLFDENVHIPFMLRFPDGRLAGVHVGALVSQVDVLPTLLALAGIAPPPGGLSGLDLQPALDRARLPRELVFAERIGDDLSDRKGSQPPKEAAVKASRDRQYMVRSATRKLLIYEDRGSAAFFATDVLGGEQVDLATQEPDAVQAALHACAQWMQSLHKPGAAAAANGLSDEEIRLLESIGYMHGTTAPPGHTPDQAPDDPSVDRAPDGDASPHR